MQSYPAINYGTNHRYYEVFVAVIRTLNINLPRHSFNVTQCRRQRTNVFIFTGIEKYDIIIIGVEENNFKGCDNIVIIISPQIFYCMIYTSIDREV